MAKYALGLVSVGALAIALASPAVAQEAPADEEQAGIREIVVTAQKREESIQDVPVAVTAVDEEALAQSSVKDIRDFAGRVPSLVVDSISAGPRGAGISLRGISFEDIEKSFDPAVGVVVDGVFIGTNTGQLLDVFDLEAIEVLRGPQGTLFGRNTIAGVINVRRAKPTGEFGVKGSIGYAEFGTWRGRGVINTPTIGDFLALKGFVYWDKTDGYYRNVTQNRRAGEYEVLTLGGTALVTPSDKISLTVTYEHVRERGETQFSQLSATPNLAFGPTNDLMCLNVPVGPGVFVRAFAIPAIECDRELLGDAGLYTTFSNLNSPVKNDGDNIYGELKIELGDFELIGVTGYQRNKEDVFLDFDASSINFFDVRRRQTYKQFSQEVRLQGDVTENINILLGGYYFDSSYTLRQDTVFGPGVLAATATPLRADADHEAKSYAAFADIQFKPTEGLTIGGGIRYTKDKKSLFNNYGVVPPLVALSIPAWDGECVQVTGLLAPGVPRYGPATNCEGRARSSKTTWRAFGSYDIGDNRLIYASYSTGFRSGGLNGRAASPTSLGPYSPETVEAYEIGLKADWIDRTLRTNIALFQTDYKNKQEEVVQPSPPGAANPQETVVRNAASARIKGIEIELTAMPADGLTFTGTMAYTDAGYRNFFRDVTGDLVPDDVSSLQLRRAPKYTWSVGIDYNREIGSGTFGLSTNFRYLDKYATCIVADSIALRTGAVKNDRRCIASPRETLDATLSYAFNIGSTGEVKLSLFGRNLLDNRGISSTLPVAGLFTFAGARPPRQLGAELGFKF
jgi:iron complex outermembrane receptor protein